MKKSIETVLLSFVMSAAFIFSAFAVESKGVFDETKRPGPTAEQRQQMADAHEKMAACLRSDQPVKECHQELMKSCKDKMGENGCSMGGGRRGGGMKQRKMMND